MKYTSILLFCFAVVFSFQLGFAQKYKPDTTLTYSEFLQQCVEFKSKTNVQEVWVVNFWASWNSPSLRAIPGIKEVHGKYKNKPVRFVSISVDKIRSKWEKRLKQYEMPWEHLNVPKQSDYDFLRRAFRHNKLPGLFVVTRTGSINRVQDKTELLAVLLNETKGLPNKPYQKPKTSSPVSPPAVVTVTNPTAESEKPSKPAVADTKPDPVKPSKPDPVKPEPTKPEPSKPEPSTPSNSGTTWVTHKVTKGDTLFSLYRKYGVSVSQIKKNNKMKDNNIKIGQVLKIKKK